MSTLVDVWLMEFEPARAEAAAENLQKMFRVDAATANKLVSTLPRSIKQRLTSTEAARFASALETIGGRVQLLPAGSPPPPKPPRIIATAADGGLLDLSQPPPEASASAAEGAGDDGLLDLMEVPQRLAVGSIDEDLTAGGGAQPAAPGDEPALTLADVGPAARPRVAIPDDEPLAPAGHVPLPVPTARPKTPPPDPRVRVWVVAAVCAAIALLRLSWASEPPLPPAVRDMSERLHHPSGQRGPSGMTPLPRY